jgi:hypothetical protein
VAERIWLEQLENQLGPGSTDEASGVLAFLAARRVRFDAAELRAARRRALLVLAAGGDPRRAFGPDEPAVRRLAADLDRAERRAELSAALAHLAEEAGGLSVVERTVSVLQGEPDLAWRWLACALLADELTDEGG